MCKNIFLFLSVVFLFFGCAHEPVVTKSLIDKQVMREKNMTLNTVFIDDREDRFKTEKVMVKMGFPVASANILGDLIYDTPLNILFEKMVVKRFGSNDKGVNTEFKLKSFYTAFKFNDLVGVPFLGVLAAGSDIEWSGILKVDVSLLDKNNKFIFSKTYDVTVTEKISESGSVADSSLIIIEKLFTKFSQDFETDIRRI